MAPSRPAGQRRRKAPHGKAKQRHSGAKAEQGEARQGKGRAKAEQGAAKQGKGIALHGVAQHSKGRVW